MGVIGGTTTRFPASPRRRSVWPGPATVKPTVPAQFVRTATRLIRSSAALPQLSAPTTADRDPALGYTGSQHASRRYLVSEPWFGRFLSRNRWSTSVPSLRLFQSARRGDSPDAYVPGPCRERDLRNPSHGIRDLKTMPSRTPRSVWRCTTVRNNTMGFPETGEESRWTRRT